MAKIWYAHFDSTPDDRRMLLAEDWAKYNRALFTDGVRNAGGNFEVAADGSLPLTVDVKGGVACVQGYILRVDADEDGGDTVSVRLPSANPYDSRVDRIVLRLDRRIERREIAVTYKMGTAGTLVPPELTRNANIWELSLARVAIGAGQTYLLQSDVTDERFDGELCGVMHSVMQLDSDSWQRQVDANIAAQIEKWNASLDGKLEEWENSLDEENARSDARFRDFDEWFAAARQDERVFGGVDFDDPYSLKGYVKTTSFPGGGVLVKISDSDGGRVFAEREVTFGGDGGVVTVERYFSSDGEVVREMTKRVTFADDGTLSETVA